MYAWDPDINLSQGLQTVGEGLTPVRKTSLPLHAKSLQLCLTATPGTPARQAPLSLGFSRHEHWCGLPCPSPPPSSVVS